MRLLIAAPDLLQACHEFVINYSLHGVGAADLDRIFRLSEAAIAKAVGGAPKNADSTGVPLPPLRSRQDAFDCAYRRKNTPLPWAAAAALAKAEGRAS